MNKSTKVSLRIICLFGIAMLLGFIPEYGRVFFGDWFCEGCRITGYSTEGLHMPIYSGCEYDCMDHVHCPQWHWGYRHWLWLFMGIALWIIQAVNIFKIIDNEE
jgi:hypothetical protein